MMAPTIPKRIVIMIPPGSLPGIIAFAMTPAIKPRMIQPIIAMISQPPSSAVTYLSRVLSLCNALNGEGYITAWFGWQWKGRG